MTPSLPRALALAVLAAGLSTIVWTALRTEDEVLSIAEIRAADSQVNDEAAAEPIPVLGQADTLTNLDGWLNTDAESFEEIRADNQLTVVQFWTYTCSNCKKTIPALQEIYAEYGDRIEIVGVHAPEFSFEKEVDNIVEAAADLGVTWPIALDTDKRNFHRWQEGPTAYWPRVYLIDGNNQIRLDQRGDGARHYVRLADYIERLLDGEA